MAKSKASYERRMRETAKKERADAKRERRLTRSDDPSGPGEAAPEIDENALLAELAELHAAFDREEMEFEEFEEKRDLLIAQLAPS